MSAETLKSIKYLQKKLSHMDVMDLSLVPYLCIFYPFSAWCPLKGYTYLKNLAAESYWFVYVSVTLKGHQALKAKYNKIIYIRIRPGILKFSESRDAQ